MTDTTIEKVSSAEGSPKDGGGLRGSTLLKHLGLMLLAFAGIALLLETVSPFRGSQIGELSYFVPAVAGLTLLTGLNGQISLGHGALMAVAAYTTAVLLEQEQPLPFLVVVLIAVVITSLVGAVVGAAAARLHGPYLAGATLALAVGLPGVALYFEEELGGEQGLTVSPPRASDNFESFFESVVGNDLSSQKFTAYVGWVLALIVLLLLSNLVVSRYGRIWRAVRDDEVAAELAGINLGRARVLAFVVSSACAAVGGVMIAIITRLTAPTTFTLVLSITLLVAIVLGGLGSLVGAIIGSIIVVFLRPFVTERGLDAGLDAAQAANIAPLIYGVVLILVMLLAPRGLVGSIRFAYLTRQAQKRMATASPGNSTSGGDSTGSGTSGGGMTRSTPGDGPGNSTT
jgi:branched-chain amino acid transport system permease protein